MAGVLMQQEVFLPGASGWTYLRASAMIASKLVDSDGRSCFR